MRCDAFFRDNQSGPSETRIIGADLDLGSSNRLQSPSEGLLIQVRSSSTKLFRFKAGLIPLRSFILPEKVQLLRVCKPYPRSLALNLVLVAQWLGFWIELLLDFYFVLFVFVKKLLKSSNADTQGLLISFVIHLLIQERELRLLQRAKVTYMGDPKF